jgi:5'-phosphate synthase pdxT subunit
VLVGVLALQGDVADHSIALAELNVGTRLVRIPEDLSGIDGIVLPGGESSTMSMLLESSGLAEPLGKELASGLPAFGTCAGMILLSRAISDGRANQRCYGAIDIAVRRNGYGGQLESFECALRVGALGEEPVHAIFIRAPVVEQTGLEVEVLARIESTPVICRQRSVLVTAFHPELSEDRRVHELFVSMIDAHVLQNR